MPLTANALEALIGRDSAERQVWEIDVWLGEERRAEQLERQAREAFLADRLATEGEQMR